MALSSLDIVSVDTGTGVTSEELARRACSGCAASFSLLASRYHARLMHVVLGRIGRSRVADAEDIVQESLTRAWQRIELYKFEYRFSTWLFTIAVRITTDHLRRWARTPASEGLDDATHAPTAHVDRVEQNDSLENIWSVAAGVLTETQYTAMWLRYGEELAVYEVARILGRTRVGTRVLLHRARAALVPHLQDDKEGQEVQPDADEKQGAVA